MPEVSVIICTHNPREQVLQRAIEGLRGQTLPLGRWEFVLVDNASAKPLADHLDLSWHPAARIVRETELGLTPARLRGIAETKGELVVFVDDDNVLDPDYLEQAVRLAAEHRLLGAFGGNCRGEFAAPLPPWIQKYLPGLVIHEVDRDHWSNAYEWSHACPYGAGMCVRRAVADTYAANVSKKTLLKKLGRTGTRLLSGEDTDLAWTAIDLGMGTGRFRALRLLHLIPEGRLTEDYIVRLYAGFRYSDTILAASRRGKEAILVNSALSEFLTLAKECLKLRGIDRKVRIAQWKARREALAVLREAT
jgi:glycosyltransferase involved in cell wall biosynthesis